MTLHLNEDQRQFQDVARAFAETELRPHAATWDAEKIFPVETLRQAAALGFAGIYCREDLGGSGLTRLDAALIFEELATACPSTAAYLTIHNMVAWLIDSFAPEALRQRLLPSLLSMETFGSYCLTEPGAGSDAASLRTRARREGDVYVLDGQKAFISGGGHSDVYVVMARTGGEGAHGISALVVEKGTPGLSFGKSEAKMGWNSQPTAAVMFDGVRVPVANRLGEEGEGFRFAMMGLDGGRLNIGACSLGGARGAMEAALAYARERKQFGRAITDFQATQFRLADMATELEAARALLHKAAGYLDAKHPEATRWCAMAKRFATDVGFKVADEALQLFGGYGYTKDYPAERLLRDLRVHRILEGTNEIMRVIIARRLLAD
ncbi:acyl-CoA dehydrogenase family protein [Pararhodospirillum photometricum]|uniref:Butyryl-CoA dehydrogenase n=1 Tax=Pararhodospirillum photometricum DSM 122 TaxID=1150469 RepID=H6SKZ3_PARPM|nr:acyl-CoA dehydrogenase family protein [Pararhodospirillum photometricum]CCG08658.1 Butyryl-CoA dehydrogenase [Pararhodospirillum photometricum DSM 122]